MKKGQRIVPEPVSDDSTTLDQFIQLTAETLEAQSVALFVVDDARRYLHVAAYFSSSDRFKPDAVIPVESSLLGDIFRKAVPLYETYYTANPRETGFYGHHAVVTSYVAAPVGTRGLLWVDTRRVHGFSARHLRLVLQLARIAEAIPQLTDSTERKSNAVKKVEFFEGLLATDATGRLNVGLFLDNMVCGLVDKWRLGGAVIGIKDPERDLLKIVSCAGFSSLMERGRIVRIKKGWVNWALENDRMVIITGQRSGEGPLTLFHAGENVGFDVKALVVVPWSEIDELNQGVLALASRTSSPILEDDRQVWLFAARLVSILQSVASREALVKGMRRYDSESGALNETGFHQQVRQAFLRAMERKGALFLFLSEITNMEDLYLSVDHIILRRFIEMYVDKLKLLTKRQAIIGKFKTGGFAVAVENMPSDEAISVAKKAASLMESGVAVVDGYQIHYRACFASASFPADAGDLRSLWRKAKERLARGASLSAQQGRGSFQS